jgi:hypothetical protein
VVHAGLPQGSFVTTTTLIQTRRLVKRGRRHRDGEAVIVPRAKAHPGFLSGQWLRALEGDALRVIHLFDTEEHARATATKIESEGPPPDAPVTLRGVETFELIAQA